MKMVLDEIIQREMICSMLKNRPFKLSFKTTIFAVIIGLLGITYYIISFTELYNLSQSGQKTEAKVIGHYIRDNPKHDSYHVIIQYKKSNKIFEKDVDVTKDAYISYSRLNTAHIMISDHGLTKNQILVPGDFTLENFGIALVFTLFLVTSIIMIFCFQSSLR